MSQKSIEKNALSRRHLLGRSLQIGAGLGLTTGTALTLAACGGGNDHGIAMSAENAALSLPELADKVFKDSKVPGLAWAVVKGDQLITSSGLGLCELGKSDPINADTAFELASVSKSLAGTVVARQVSEGHVAWDSRMQVLLPWFALRNSGSTAQLTVGDLFAHRSGLLDHAGDSLEVVGYTQRETLERMRLLPVKPLRSDYAYTNFGLTAAAIAVAQAVGTDWASLSKQALYAPLGMSRTTSSNAEFMAQKNRATSHVRASDGSWKPSKLRNADPQSPAGGASSSVNDMARWLSLLLANGSWKGQQLIAASALLPAMQPQATTGQYGFGFVIGTTKAGRSFSSHSGAFLSGASTCFMVIPSLNVGIVALTNGIPIGVPETLCNQFVDLMENGRLTQDWWSMFSQRLAPLLAPEGSLVGQSKPSNPADPGPLARYTGVYDNAYYGPLQVNLVNGALQLDFGPAHLSYPLSHWSGTQFTFTGIDEIAAPNSISLATFNMLSADASSLPSSVWLELYDQDGGQGVFTRRA